MRAPSPRLLVVCSLLLFAVFAIGVLLSRHGPSQPSAPPTTPAPFAIGPVRVRAGAFAATLSWRTPSESTAVVAWGPSGMQPLLSLSRRDWSTTHRIRLTGLSPNARYTVTISAAAQDEETDARSVEIATGAIPPNVSASTRAGAVRVDGAPVFPLITWQECPDRWTPDIRAGITLFGGNPCTGLSNLLAAVAGRALVAGTTDDAAGTTGSGLIGWFYPDEADARGLAAESLVPGGPGIRFLTLTSHFFSLAAPLPGGRSMYPGLVANADVVGFDLYPLQELCRPELLPWVFDAQRELRRLAPGKPTYQWIEIREMKCPQAPAAVTPATIRVESWLAIAGGATGLGFFPPDWSAATGRVIRGIAMRIRQLGPVLFQRPLDVAVEPASPDVRASARRFGGRVYVIAVNAGTTAAAVRLQAPGRAPLAVALPPRSVRISGGP